MQCTQSVNETIRPTSRSMARRHLVWRWVLSGTTSSTGSLARRHRSNTILQARRTDVPMSSWNCSAVLDEQPHVNSRRCWSAVRQSAEVDCPALYRLNSFGRLCFAVVGPSTWNSLPDSLRDQELSGIALLDVNWRPTLNIDTETYPAHWRFFLSRRYVTDTLLSYLLTLDCQWKIRVVLCLFPSKAKRALFDAIRSKLSKVPIEDVVQETNFYDSAERTVAEA